MSSPSNPKILVIDYEPRSIESVLRPLQDAGYDVEVANDGLAGIEAFERTKPDLVLVEAMLPKKHGFEVCQAIKAAPGGHGTPVLITTAVYKGRRYRNEALSVYGCDEYVEKPIPEERLLSLCGRFLNREDADAVADAPPAEAATPGEGPAETDGPQEPAALEGLTEEEIVDRLDTLLDGIQSSRQTAAPPAEAETPSDEATAEPPRAARGGELTSGNVDQAVDDLFDELNTSSGPTPEDAPEVDDADVDSMTDEVDTATRHASVEPGEAPAEASAPEREDAAAFRPPASGTVVSEDDPDTPGATGETASPAPAGEHEETVAEAVDTESSAAEATAPDVESTPSGKRGLWIALAASAALIVGAAVAWYFVRDPGAAAGVPASLPTVEPVVTSRADVPPAPSFTPTETSVSSVPASLGATGIGTVEPETGPQPSSPQAPPSEARTSPRKPVRTESNATPPQGQPAGSTAEAGLGNRTTAGASPSSSPSTEPSGTAPQPAVPSPEPAVLSPATVASTSDPYEGTTPDRTETQTAAPPGESNETPVPQTPRPETQESALDTATPAIPETGEGTADAAPAAGSSPPDTVPAPAAEPPEEKPAVESWADTAAASATEPEPEPEPETPAAPTVIRGQLIALSDVDEPPFPVHKPAPEYDRFAKKLGQQGTVVLQLLINDEGRVADVEFVTRIPNSRLNDSAANAAREWIYRPAYAGGVPVQVWITEKVVFQL